MSEEQMNLAMQVVELTTEERIERGRQLAETLLALVRMKEFHAESKKAMKEDEEALEEQIAHLRDVVRYAQEERPVGIAR